MTDPQKPPTPDDEALVISDSEANPTPSEERERLHRELRPGPEPDNEDG